MEIRQHRLHLTNSLGRQKVPFEPLNPSSVGMYVCGPTVYGDPHLGHARPGIVFDVVYRYLLHLGYKVRYVRNITDVGHLENDADEGEDKIARRARLEQLEPMEVVQYYTNRYHWAMDLLNVKSPSIEPHASGHIIEQISFVGKILEAGYAYEKNGSVYFDVVSFNKDHGYGKLSGRNVDDLMAYTRELEGGSEKRNSFDFALWKKAQPSHIMRWPSPWGEGYPGWHMECSAMGTRYLGEHFDIHGGGMDLLFPHHECEIAQSVAANGKTPVRYWMHNNMVTINGQKMGKSLGNAVSLEDFFTGSHELLEKDYSPMTIRFFMLQAHYGSTVDFSNDALRAAEKGMSRLLKAVEVLEGLSTAEEGDFDAEALQAECYAAMDDDFNTPQVIASLFDGVRIINSAAAGDTRIDAKNLAILRDTYHAFLFDILGLRPGEKSDNGERIADSLMGLVTSLRQDARERKDFGTADKIRDALNNMNITLKDTREGTTWEFPQ